jgi:hypothetical protein
MDSVLKVYCVHTEPNHSMPWQRKRQYPSSSSGFVAAVGDQKWILTNAHSVDYHTQVRGGAASACLPRPRPGLGSIFARGCHPRTPCGAPRRRRPRPAAGASRLARPAAMAH